MERPSGRMLTRSPNRPPPPPTPTPLSPAQEKSARNTDSRWRIKTFIRFQTKTPTVILGTWSSPSKNKDESRTVLKARFDRVTSRQVTLTCRILTLRARPRNRNGGQTAGGRPTGQVQRWPSPGSSEPASQNHKHMTREGERKCLRTNEFQLSREGASTAGMTQRHRDGKAASLWWGRDTPPAK